MANISIPYQSFCWVIGTTSFRTAKLNLKIEKQLLLLDEFYNKTIKTSAWNWNSDYSLVIAPVVADLCTTPVALSAPPNSYQNNSQS